MRSGGGAKLAILSSKFLKNFPLKFPHLGRNPLARTLKPALFSKKKEMGRASAETMLTFQCAVGDYSPNNKDSGAV